MFSNLSNKRILLGICGGIGAYKSAELARRLQEKGAEVRVVMTKASQEFITPLTFQALTGNPVYSELFDDDIKNAMGHIELARWADLILIVPATANFMAQLAQGHANDLLTTLCLATTAPIAIAPAMNQQMWLHPATQHNADLLRQRGVHQLGPDSGIQACGEIGWGRLLEPQNIIEMIEPLFHSQRLQGKSVLITAGPTQEKIDPIRYLTNHSSGKMGYALAEAAHAAGAKVTLITGPVTFPRSLGVQTISVITALEMHEAILNVIAENDMFISAAAVSDYRCHFISENKIKKSEERMTLELIRNPDILSEVAALRERPYIVGFAAETHTVNDYAKQKLIAKKLDMIIANQVGLEGQGFQSDNNQVTVITAEDEIFLPLQSKRQVATKLIEIIADNYETKVKQHE